MFKIFCRSVLGLALTCLFGAEAAFCQVARATPVPKKTPNRQIACPPIIADKESATQFKGQAKGNKGRFACYRTAKDATKDGYSSLRVAQNKDFTGWYRVNLKSVKDTCGSFLSGIDPVLFLQVRETEAGVFGDFCPSLGQLSGINTPNGFVISALSESDVAQDVPAAQQTLCAEGKIRTQQVFEFNQVVDGGKAFSVTYSRVRSCSSEASGAATCIVKFEGIGFHETHPIWPPVPENITTLPQGCAVAMTKCADCHEGLK